jgi:hypothetical protein
MTVVSLASSTANRAVDDILRRTIGAVEAALPGRVQAYYLSGSHVDGTALPASDIDLVVVAPDDLATEEERVIQAAVDECADGSPIELGAKLMRVRQLRGIYNPVLKLASLFLYGQDIRDAVPLVPVDEWARRCMHGIYQVMRPASVVTYPLSYPDPDAEFYGYEDTVRLPDGSTRQGTRGLVTGAGWLATALIARTATSNGPMAVAWSPWTPSTC